MKKDRSSYWGGEDNQLGLLGKIITTVIALAFLIPILIAWWRWLV